MFEKQRAKRIYKIMLINLKSMKKENMERSTGVCLSGRKANQKVVNRLSEMSNNDGYVFRYSSCLSSIGDAYTIYTIEEKSHNKVLK